MSSFYFQKIFNVLCGFTVGEYIRNRRLTLAAQELCSSDIKVIDAAMKYGYDSPDSFSRAFTKFHGVNPVSYTHLAYCTAKKLPLVLCTTGLSEEQLAQVAKASESTAVLRSANMSLEMCIRDRQCAKPYRHQYPA